ncbi:MAG: hypothetical protein KH204_09535, partial [[Eubacterium] rectale]|nr:hypothetical protein [Agathobacter rectalis]
GRSAWTQPGGHITNGEEYIGEASQGDDVSGKRRGMRASHIKAVRMPGWHVVYSSENYEVSHEPMCG